MSIIIFRLMNNYYDDEFCGEGIDAPYSAFGYFDGISIHHVPDSENGIDINLGINNMIVENYNAQCNCRNIVCFTDDKEKSEKFWKVADQNLYLFISLVRINNMEGNYDIPNDINQNDNAICLFSYDHSELVVVHCNNKYYDCMDFGANICKKIKGLRKVYTISAFKEEITKHSDSSEEKVSVHFKCSVKDFTKFEVFLNEFANKIEKSLDEIKVYDTLANDDILIEIENVVSMKLLKCYLQGEILNHNNEMYNNCFYNIESQIIKKRC